jgi:hypothetical protein
MKTKLAYILGLAVLATSFICGGSLAYADALEAESSALLTLAPDANASGAESLDKPHCVFYSDGADNCIVNTQLTVVDQPSSAIGETEPSATEAAPTIQFVDAIAVIVTQSITPASPGLIPENSEEPASAESMPTPSATEPVLNSDAKTTTDASSAPAGRSADAIVVAIVQSATIAVPGQNLRDSEEAAPTGSISEATAPILMLEAKTPALDRAE